MNTRFKAVSALAAGLLAVTLSACGSDSSESAPTTSSGGNETTAPATDGGSSDKPFKVVAFTSGNQTPVGAWWVKAVQAKADELGWDLTMVQGDFDFTKMNPAVESAIGQGTDLVFDGYTDYASVESITQAAKDAGVPVFAIDSGTEPTDVFALNVTTDQQSIVDQEVQAISDKLGGLEGKTVMVIGHDPHAGIRMRAGLAEAAFKAAGATVEVVKVQSPATGRTEALTFVADYLAAHPDGLDGVWAGWDDAALGASQAIDEAGAHAVVTGVDALAETIAKIQEGGSFLATISQPWPEINDQVVAAIEAYRKDGTLPSTNFAAAPVTLVTAANAASVTPSDKLG